MPINAQQAFEEVFGSHGRLPAPLPRLSERSPQDQYKADVAYWFGTLMNAGSQWKTDLLHRMWAIIWHCSLWMKNRSNVWKSWNQSQIPVASCLSHGGRVLVQLPPDDFGNVWRWLWCGHDPERRLGATHGVEIGSFGIMPDGRAKKVMEVKKDKAGGQHFGVNIAGGGLHNVNPISRNTIRDDGRHGHLYIYYVAPEWDKPGALMFGAEDSAPIDRADTQMNQVIGGFLGNALLPLTLIDLMTGAGTLRQPLSPGLRAAFPKGQTGAYHAFGVSGKYSLTGGKKFKELARQPQVDVPNGEDSMFVNPPAKLLQELGNDGAYARRFRKEWLGDSPLETSHATVQTLPSVKDFKKQTDAGTLHFRHDSLKNMTTSLENYYKGGVDKEHHLRQFISWGQDYLVHTQPRGAAALTSLGKKVSQFVMDAREMLH